MYGDLQWPAGHTGLEENQIPSLPWRVLLWSERNRNVNILIIDWLQVSAVKANTEVHKVDGMTTWPGSCDVRLGDSLGAESGMMRSGYPCVRFLKRKRPLRKSWPTPVWLCSPGTGKGGVPRTGTAHIIKLKPGQWPPGKVASRGAECTTWWHKVFWGAEDIRNG